MFGCQNLLFVIGVAAARFILGMVWYSFLFGAQWQLAMRESGKTGPKDMTMPLGMNFLAALATSFVLCHITNLMDITTVFDGALLGFICWLGFVIPSQLDILLFERQHKALFLINTTFQLIALMLMGALYGIWY